MLTELGCDTGQGYYFARPLDERAFDNWLRNWTGLVRRGADRDNVLSFPAHAAAPQPQVETAP